MLWNVAFAESCAPQNPIWKQGSTATATWDGVESADYYLLNIHIYHNGTELGSVETGTSATEVDVQQEVNKLIKGGAYSSVQLSYTVKAGTYDSNGFLVYGIESEPSPLLEYEYALVRLSPPSDITLNPDGTATWRGVYGADYYSVFVYISSNGDKYANNSTQTFVSGKVDANGMFTCDVKELFDILYREAGLYNGEAARFYIQAESMSYDTNSYVNSERSASSNTVEYALREQVESLSLSPSAPVLYEGNSYYLGKTILPENAYYTSIDWNSSDETIVTVDDSGLICGIGPGSASITASIGAVADTVDVTVYSIASNIEDPDEKESVTDAAGDIIDDIANNSKPDLGNTDIPEENIENIQKEVQEGLWRGDAFFTDIVWYEETFGKYKNNWDQVQKVARDLNAQFAGAYNIEVEMYHKDDSGTDYHIGNIIELENEVTFTFDLPTGMNEIQSGYARKYVLVRIHNNNIEAIDVDIDANSFTAQSDCFSDFILLYADTPVEDVDLSAYSKLVLPDSTNVIQQESFMGTDAEVVVIPPACTKIESRAFENCSDLKYIVVSPESDIVIADDAFDHSKVTVLYQ